VPDLPALFDAIRREAHWLALAAHLNDNGEYDLAVVVRGWWDVARDGLRDELTPEQVIVRFRAWPPRLLRRLARRARDADERELRR